MKLKSSVAAALPAHAQGNQRGKTCAELDAALRARQALHWPLTGSTLCRPTWRDVYPDTSSTVEVIRLLPDKWSLVTRE